MKSAISLFPLSVLIVFSKYYHASLLQFLTISLSEGDHEELCFDQPESCLKNENATNLLSIIASACQSGAKISEHKRKSIASLSQQLSFFSDPKPAHIQLTGSHRLLYGDSSDPSAGNIGPFVAKVESFAERRILDDVTIQVKYKELVMKCFGFRIFSTIVNGIGEWKQVFVGIVNDGQNKKLLRIMNAPNL